MSGSDRARAEHDAGSEATAPGETDRGREAQPADAEAVREAGERTERLDEHSGPADDAAGIVPTRTQQTPPADADGER